MVVDLDVDLESDGGGGGVGGRWVTIVAWAVLRQECRMDNHAKPNVTTSAGCLPAYLLLAVWRRVQCLPTSTGFHLALWLSNPGHAETQILTCRRQHWQIWPSGFLSHPLRTLFSKQ